MILVGLTGGIGSGKSTVAQLLNDRGVVIIDADAIAREVQAPGSPVVQELVTAFGADILGEDGSLRRDVLAQKVFSDPEAVKTLNKLVHPAIGREMNRRILAARTSNDLVVLDIPLLTENPREGLQAVVVVDVPEEVQVERLVAFRGFDEADARARIARQASREQRLATATIVIDNSGSVGSLHAQVDAAVERLMSLPQLPADYEPIAPTPKT